jgi:hypothetical protein
MFGITRLTPEEKAEHVRKKRCEELDKLLKEQMEIRAKSLVRSEELLRELEALEG